MSDQTSPTGTASPTPRSPITPLIVERVESTFFDNRSLFPEDSAELNNALLMRDIDHTWHTHVPLEAPNPCDRKSLNAETLELLSS